MTPYLKKVATFKKEGRRELPLLAFGELVRDWGQANRYAGRNPAQFFVCYIDALPIVGNEEGLTVKWNGSQADWFLCAYEFVNKGLVQRDYVVTERIAEDIIHAVGAQPRRRR